MTLGASGGFHAWTWVWDVEWMIAVVLFGVWYAWFSHVHRIPTLRRLAFWTGLLLIAAALFSPIEHVALESMVSFHLLQNVMLADWAPPLLVLGLTEGLARQAERFRVVRAMTRPQVALPFWLAVWYLVHIPGVYELALENRGWLGVEHLLFILAGLCFWWPVLVPGRMSPGPRLIYLCLAFFLGAPIALAIALADTTIYSFYDTTPHLFDLTPLEDQSIGGMLMSIEQSAILFAAAFYALLQLLREDDSQSDAVGSTR
jgi:cytochrome c oxidase assembly factor CtaG